MTNEQKALLALVDTIDATGGVKKDDKGYIVPVCAEEWIDLGEAYELACVALGRKVKVEQDES